MPGGQTVVAGAVGDVTGFVWAIAGVIAAVALLVLVWRGVKRVEVKAGRVHVDVEAMAPKLDKAATATEAIETQLRPNGGSTLRDAVDRIEWTVAAGFAALDERLTAVEEAVTNPGGGR